jgi:putative protein kinase ArgK-like GTPase of G3E family
MSWSAGSAPTRKTSCASPCWRSTRPGGALLGDRIRMNALDGGHVFFRSLATRGAREMPETMAAIITACKAAG